MLREQQGAGASKVLDALQVGLAGKEALNV
jgi:hypothetical protein